LVADHLGVDAHQLAAEVSLTEDLAADSLDLAELALGLEEEFAITVPQRVLDHVRTYRELVRAILLLARAARHAEARAAQTPARIFLPGEQLRSDTCAQAGRAKATSPVTASPFHS